MSPSTPDRKGGGGLARTGTGAAQRSTGQACEFVSRGRRITPGKFAGPPGFGAAPHRLGHTAKDGDTLSRSQGQGTKRRCSVKKMQRVELQCTAAARWAQSRLLREPDISASW